MNKSIQIAAPLIREFEGLRLKAYHCPAGVLTIGYGHTVGVSEGMIISRERAEELLLEDLEVFRKQLVGLGLKLNDNQEAALLSFTFNVGFGSLSRSTLLKKVRANPSDPAIAAEFAKWCHARGGKQLPGLVRRRKVEAELYFTV